MKTFDTKLFILEQKREKLEEEIKSLRTQKTLEIASTLALMEELSLVDGYTLIGAIQESLKSIENNPEKKGVWQQAGQKFCKKHATFDRLTPSLKPQKGTTKSLENQKTKQDA